MLKVGICGAGRFGSCFVPLFGAHPQVEEVVLADTISERAANLARQHSVARIVDSLDDLCRTDVDAVAILTQRNLHGPQVLQCLSAGKHVLCAVPMALNLDEVCAIVRTVEKTGLAFMTAETSYYYPSAIYCRNRFNAGDFGTPVYAEAQYLHDMSHFYASFQHSGGADWKRLAGIPPMYYASHSVSMILSVSQARATHVCCLGIRDDHSDEIFRIGHNAWDNEFSNECALIRTSDGAVIRINEMRRIGWYGGKSVYMSFFGTGGSFEQNAVSSCWLTRDKSDLTDVTELLECVHGPKPATQGDGSTRVGEEFFAGTASVHPVGRLPETFRALPNGHYGSHQFLVQDFVEACTEGKVPPCNVWNSANWCAPGLVAHESARRAGEMMEVPQFSPPTRALM